MGTVTTRIDQSVKAEIEKFRSESGIDIRDSQIVSEGVLLWLQLRGSAYVQAKRQMEGA